MPVDALRERPADAFDLGDVVDRRRLHAAQAAEVLDQRLPALRADARDLVQHRGGARLAAARAVPDHGEAVRLIADRLDEMQPGVRGRELQASRLRLDDELLHPGLALRALGDPDHAYLVQAEVGEHAARDADLTLAAVDEDEIGHLAGFGGDALVAALEHLAHRAVVVPGRDAANVEAPVLRLLHLLAVVDHARSHRRLTHRVADVEALDAARALGKRERLAQRREARLLRGAVAHALRDRELGVLARHVEPHSALAVRWTHGMDVFQLHRLAGDQQSGQRLV